MTDQVLAKKVDYLCAWLRERVSSAGAKGLAVGMSGGIDSSLTAFLIKKAFPESSLGIILPCHSNPDDRRDALAAAEACGIDHIEISLDSSHDILAAEASSALESYRPGTDTAFAAANLKARLRMSSIYFTANALNYLVAGTDNKAESYTGYFTKFGDGGADLLPLSGLTKRDVRALAAYLGVPRDIIVKAPSAGLWEGQTDEGEMGITYDMIDDFLDGKEIPAEAEKILRRLHEKSEHKRTMPYSPSDN